MGIMLARFVGVVLRGMFAAILLLRRPRPIHARGLILTGELTWLANSPPAGVAWIDDRPDRPVPVVARLSRSVGLPGWLPDVIGLAMRVQVDAGPEGGRRPVDLELASTGGGVPSRFMLIPHRRPSAARLTTLLPYRGMRGPVLIGARTRSPRSLPGGRAAIADALRRDPWRLRLFHARPTGAWQAFADLELGSAVDREGEQERFDRVRNPLPGAGTYDWVRAVHQPSYRLTQGG